MSGDTSAGRLRVFGVGSSNDALLQQRGKVIAIEMDAAANADGLIGPSSASSSKILSATAGLPRRALNDIMKCCLNVRMNSEEFHIRRRNDLR